MAFATTLDAPYFTGAATVDPDSRYDIGLAGHGYMLDWEKADQFRRQSVEMIRQQSDTSERPGEQSINPAGLWRRTQESWHHGGGQSWADKADSDPYRFNTSKGVDPWAKGGLGLLNATAPSLASANTNVKVTVAVGTAYAIDGQQVKVFSSGTWIALTGNPAVTAVDITSDGNDTYVAYGGSGIYKGNSVLSSYVTGNVQGVEYVKGRLMAWSGTKLYNITAAGALPTPLLDHTNLFWDWVDCAPGRGCIYVAGSVADKSLIYRTAVKPDGTALDVPQVAGELPDGEVVYSITGYLGFLVIGTSLGVRFAAADDSGDLTLGALIPTAGPVRCAEGQDRFVWFGWEDYDTSSTGLGRLDLSTFTAPLTPAYASDLMVTGQGDVTSTVFVLDGELRFLTVAGLGVYVESASKVASGTVTSGRVTFGLPDDKTALYAAVRHDPLPAATSVTLTVAVGAGAATTVGLSDTDGSTNPVDQFTLNGARGNDFEWAATLTGDVTLRSVTLRADPAPERTEYIYVPILLADTLGLPGEVDEACDVYEEWAFLRELRNGRRVVAYQEGLESCRVIVDDDTWLPTKRTADRRFYQGTYVLRLKEV